MSRIVHLTVSYATIVGYFLAVTWAPAWHDHHHGHCHAHAAKGSATEPVHAGHSHGRCCSHHHPSCHEETPTAPQHAPAHSPCHSPLHDDDCVVCQILAHPPLAAPTIALVDAAEPVRDWVLLSSPQAARSLPSVYDSRGPPLV